MYSFTDKTWLSLDNTEKYSFSFLSYKLYHNSKSEYSVIHSMVPLSEECRDVPVVSGMVVKTLISSFYSKIVASVFLLIISSSSPWKIHKINEICVCTAAHSVQQACFFKGIFDRLSETHVLSPNQSYFNRLFSVSLQDTLNNDSQNTARRSTRINQDSSRNRTSQQHSTSKTKSKSITKFSAKSSSKTSSKSPVSNRTPKRRNSKDTSILQNARVWKKTTLLGYG